MHVVYFYFYYCEFNLLVILLYFYLSKTLNVSISL